MNDMENKFKFIISRIWSDVYLNFSMYFIVMSLFCKITDNDNTEKVSLRAYDPVSPPLVARSTVQMRCKCLCYSEDWFRIIFELHTILHGRLVTIFITDIYFRTDYYKTR